MAKAIKSWRGHVCSRSPSLVPANIVRCNEGSERRAKGELRKRPHLKSMRRALAVEFFICFLLSLRVSPPSSARLSHHPHPTERPSSDNSRILVILDWSDKKRALSLSLSRRRRRRRDSEGQMAREKMAKGKRQRTESTTKIIAERNEEESDGADGGEEEGRSVVWYGGWRMLPRFFHLPFSGKKKRRQGQETKGWLNPHQIRPSFGGRRKERQGRGRIYSAPAFQRTRVLQLGDTMTIQMLWLHWLLSHKLY